MHSNVVVAVDLAKDHPVNGYLNTWSSGRARSAFGSTPYSRLISLRSAVAS